MLGGSAGAAPGDFRVLVQLAEVSGQLADEPAARAVQARLEEALGESERRFYMTVDGEPEEVTLEMTGDMAGGAAATESRPGRRMRATDPGHVTAAMPGNVVEVLVKEGQSVNAGDPVLVIEAMKMETEIKAAVSGVVVSVFVKKGDRITPAETLLDIKP